MISYAQNFEDVMLARALESVERGFYIDIGAWHPDRHSVTRHFYELGWNGINVEPGRTYFSLLKRRRPRDLNLNLAVSSHLGPVRFHETPRSGISGCDDTVLVEARRHGFATRTFETQATTLAALCEQHVADREIHFMKVDVEGHEAVVLRSGNWHRFRPWIVVVESVTATREPVWRTFEPLLLDSGYLHAWYDGLNRFYVRRESDALLKHFALPPNLFDGVVKFPDDPFGRTLALLYRLYRAAKSSYRRMAG
ncbi:MAG: FkbM family methyltransferase [Betaproteobacteria bacterium]|nr:MAG: FkbM family methyltransferase [Betaproteobacteria bacterium]